MIITNLKWFFTQTARNHSSFLSLYCSALYYVYFYFFHQLYNKVQYKTHIVSTSNEAIHIYNYNEYDVKTHQITVV